jgi:hypothetical protein
MSKQATIASLVRTAAKSESEFVETVNGVFDEDDPERIAEFFDKLNIPRSQGAEGGLLDPLPDLTAQAANLKVWDFEIESKISYGIQRFLDRHERKIKWHAGHPSIEGSENVMLLFRAAMATTDLRLRRQLNVLKTKDELTPDEWWAARKMMNNAYMSFRNFLGLVASNWIDAMNGAVPHDELAERLGSFYELVDAQVQKLEEHKQAIEDRRRELTVLPEGYPPVKPPVYFHGDLLGKGPWKLYWSTVNGRAHYFREAAG